MLPAAISLFCGCSKFYRNTVSYNSATDNSMQKSEARKMADGMTLDNTDVRDNQVKMFVNHETPPRFSGGESAMLSYIYDNLKYPQDAYDRNILCYIGVC